MDRDGDEDWFYDALARGDIAAIMKRVADEPGYLASRDHLGEIPLKAAIGYGNLSLVESMLGHGADPNVEVDDGYTCLLTAIESEDPASLRIVAALIRAGADVNRPGRTGWTPLHMTAVRGQVEKARLLIEAGADVDRRKAIDAEETPLMEAAYNGRAGMVRLLLDHGADPSLRDTIHDWTPLEMAEYGAKGADPAVLEHIKETDYGPILADVRDYSLANSGLSPEQIELLKAHLEDVDMEAQYREAADQRAREGDFDGVIRLLSASGGHRRDGGE